MCDKNPASQELKMRIFQDPEEFPQVGLSIDMMQMMECHRDNQSSFEGKIYRSPVDPSQMMSLFKNTHCARVLLINSTFFGLKI